MKHPGSNLQLTDRQLETLGRGFRLSPREKQVIALLFEGLATNAQIAERLETTPGAIQSATHTLYLKTGTRSRHELLVRCALEFEEAQLRQVIAEQHHEIERLRSRIEELLEERARRLSPE